MIALFCLLLTLSLSPFKSKSRLEAENAALRHQLIVLQRRVRGRFQLTNGDRLFLVMLYRWFPSILKAITIIRPETVASENSIRRSCPFLPHQFCSDCITATRRYDFWEGHVLIFGLRPIFHRCCAIATV